MSHLLPKATEIADIFCAWSLLQTAREIVCEASTPRHKPFANGTYWQTYQAAIAQGVIHGFRDRLAEECDDPHFRERLQKMALDLIAKADDIDELPPECELGIRLDSAHPPTIDMVGLVPADTASAR